MTNILEKIIEEKKHSLDLIKKDKSLDRYFAIASMKGKIIHADKLKNIAFIKWNILMI